jgi:cytochrome c oxidase subunit 4
MEVTEQHSHHIDSVKTYAIVFIALIALTFITTGVAYIDLGPFSVVVALAIACIKMMLVALWFMHVRHSSRLTKLVVAGALLWLAILIFFTMGDIVSRGWLGVPGR